MKWNEMMNGRIGVGFCQHLNEKRSLKESRTIANTHMHTQGTHTDIVLGIGKVKNCRKLNRSWQFSEKTSPYIIKSSVLPVCYFLNLIKNLYHRV